MIYFIQTFVYNILPNMSPSSVKTKIEKISISVYLILQTCFLVLQQNHVWTHLFVHMSRTQVSVLGSVFKLRKGVWTVTGLVNSLGETEIKPLASAPSTIYCMSERRSVVCCERYYRLLHWFLCECRLLVIAARARAVLGFVFILEKQIFICD